MQKGLTAEDYGIIIIPLLASVHKEMIVRLNVELCKESWSTCEVMNV